MIRTWSNRVKHAGLVPEVAILESADCSAVDGIVWLAHEAERSSLGQRKGDCEVVVLEARMAAVKMELNKELRLVMSEEAERDSIQSLIFHVQLLCRKKRTSMKENIWQKKLWFKELTGL